MNTNLTSTTFTPQHHSMEIHKKGKGMNKHNTVFRQVSVSSNKKHAWAVTEDYQLFQLVNTYHNNESDKLKGVWKKIDTEKKIFDLSVGIDGSLYVLDISYELLEWLPAKSEFRMIESPDEMRQVSVARNGLLVTLDINSNLWMFDSSHLKDTSTKDWNQGWKRLSIKHCKYVSISGDAKELWAIDMIDNTAKRFDYAENTWEDFDSPKLRDLSVTDDGQFVYGLSIDGHHILKLDTTKDIKNWKNAKNDTTIFNNISACDESTLGVIQSGSVFELKKMAQQYLKQQQQQHEQQQKESKNAQA